MDEEYGMCERYARGCDFPFTLHRAQGQGIEGSNDFYSEFCIKKGVGCPIKEEGASLDFAVMVDWVRNKTLIPLVVTPSIKRDIEVLDQPAFIDYGEVALGDSANPSFDGVVDLPENH